MLDHPWKHNVKMSVEEAPKLARLHDIESG
jgi:hypothetical protein